jgi:acylglycerol lipase
MSRLFALLLALLTSACGPYVFPPGEPQRAPVLGESAIAAADGVELPLRRWLPEGPPRTVILALHGFND